MYVPVFTTTTKTSSSTNSTSSHSTTSYNKSKTEDVVVHILTDDAAGGFGNFGTANYAGKSLNVRLVSRDSKTQGYSSDYEKADLFEQSTMVNNGTPTAQSNGSGLKGKSYNDSEVGEEVLAASTISVTYAEGFSGPTARTQQYTPPMVSIDLAPYTSDYVVPNSVRFVWMGHVYEDYDGVVVRDRTSTSAGIVSGQLNYSTGVVSLYDYIVDGPVSAFTLQSMWTARKNWTTASIFMRTQAAPIKPSAFVMNLSDTAGNQITATGDLNGNITGTHLRGKIEYETGVVELQFGDFVLDSLLTAAEKAEWWYNADDVGAVQAGRIWRPWPVDPATLRYNSVVYFYLPIDADLLGIDPVRLPPDGRVAIFQPGGPVVVGHTGVMSPATVSNGQTLNTGRTRLSRVRVLGSNGLPINTGYTTDLEAGTVTFTDVTGYLQPVTVEHRIEDMAVVRDVGIDGTLALTRQLTHAFPVPGSYVSSALMAGDLRSRVSVLFDQASWNGITWTDTVQGNAATGTYNDILAPIEVTNVGASTERFALRFTSSTGFEVIGEHVGVIAVGTINADCAPINPATGEPYFTIRALGWGTGWSVGNILRINTVGALFPLWVVRTTQQGPEAGLDYKFSLLTRGDVDRP
ncbi:hypothetical protein Acf1_00068 [Acidovorax phage ACF1]|nr:hypothetical protein Acf1_00068 [Acidovorax phage ACF1]